MRYDFQEQDAYSFARHVGISARHHGDELKFKECPYCHGGEHRDIDTFAINLRTGQFKCLRSSCSASGNMVVLSRDFGFSLGTEVDEYFNPRKQFRKLPAPKDPIKPKDAAVAYMKSRGISEETTKAYEITVQNKNDNVIVFPFYDEKGILQFVKYRKTDFVKGKDKNKEWCEANCKPILFGMKQCSGFERLVITEGQIDSLSCAEAGIPNTVSVPTGMNGFTWVSYCWNWIMKFNELIVFGDMENGRMSLLEDLKRRFPKKIRSVREQDYQGCKDANEILMKYGKDAVKSAVENAELLPVERVIRLAEVESVNIYELEKVRTGIRSLDRLLYGGLHFGQVVIIAGKRGDGKSTFASQVIASALSQNYRVFVYSGELPNYLFKAWLDFQIAGQNHITENERPDGSPSRFITNENLALINKWYWDNIYIYDSRVIESDEQEDLIKTITEAIMRYDLKIVLIDNLMTAIDLDMESGDSRYEKQGSFVKKLEKLSLRFNVIILLVAHRRKNGFSTDANDEISGSADITNAAGVVVSYDRDKELLPEQRKLIVSKSRLVGKLDFKGITLNYDEKSKRIYQNNDELTLEYGWNDPDFISVEDMEIPFE